MSFSGLLDVGLLVDLSVHSSLELLDLFLLDSELLLLFECFNLFLNDFNLLLLLFGFFFLRVDDNLSNSDLFFNSFLFNSSLL